MKDNKWMNVIIVVFFFMMLFLVESSAVGSEHVALYNNGFGTFDMKQYNDKMVYEVLENVEQGYIPSIKLYYLVDYIFCISFFAFQSMTSFRVFKNMNTMTIRNIHIGIAAVRGIADIIENTLLLYVIYSFPDKHSHVVAIASCFTKLKLTFIPLWVVIFVVGILINFRSRVRNK